jgi:hypothetical protein
LFYWFGAKIFLKNMKKSCTINGAAFLLRLKMPITHESNRKFKSTPLPNNSKVLTQKSYMMSFHQCLGEGKLFYLTEEGVFPIGK